MCVHWFNAHNKSYGVSDALISVLTDGEAEGQGTKETCLSNKQRRWNLIPGKLSLQPEYLIITLQGYTVWQILYCISLQSFFYACIFLINRLCFLEQFKVYREI